MAWVPLCCVLLADLSLRVPVSQVEVQQMAARQVCGKGSFGVIPLALSLWSCRAILL